MLFTSLLTFAALLVTPVTAAEKASFCTKFDLKCMSQDAVRRNCGSSTAAACASRDCQIYARFSTCEDSGIKAGVHETKKLQQYWPQKLEGFATQKAQALCTLKHEVAHINDFGRHMTYSSTESKAYHHELLCEQKFFNANCSFKMRNWTATDCLEFMVRMVASRIGSFINHCLLLGKTIHDCVNWCVDAFDASWRTECRSYADHYYRGGDAPMGNPIGPEGYLREGKTMPAR